MLNASLLSIIEEAGIAVLTLTEGIEQAEFASSRLTRAETQRQLHIMGESAANLPPQVHTLLAEVDWEGWETVTRRINADGVTKDEALWFAVRSLVPATLMWLRVYHKSLPEIFECKPPADMPRDTPS